MLYITYIYLITIKQLKVSLNKGRYNTCIFNIVIIVTLIIMYYKKMNIMPFKASWILLPSFVYNIIIIIILLLLSHTNLHVVDSRPFRPHQGVMKYKTRMCLKCDVSLDLAKQAELSAA